MPPTFDISRNIQKTLWDLQNSDPMLDLDSKVQVTTGGDKAKVVVSTQHKKEINIQKLHDQVSEIAANHVNHNFQLDLNPSGSFVKGGPAGDTGLTGRKIVVDAYGPSVPVGGGAFSGKDPSKVDRSAAYAARHIAKNLVAAGVADECLVQVGYAIGVAKPMSVYVNTYNSSKINLSDYEISKIVEETFDLSPFHIEQRLKLRNPIYFETASYGHMGRNPQIVKKSFVSKSGEVKEIEVELFTWEKLDYVEILKNKFNV